jgi:hypothetical protein
MAVSPNSSQLRIYAANVVAQVELPDDFPVKLAVVQPQLHKEALVRVTTVGELTRFRHYVEGVVDAQVNGHDRRGAGSLDACTWCPARDGCFHRVNLVGSMLADLTTPVKMADHLIDSITKSRAAMKKVIDECAAAVAEHPKRFPNWTRIQVNDARKWSDLIEASEIESQLIDAGATEVHTLKTPAKIKDGNADLIGLVDSLCLDQGQHVRLRPGAPKGASSESATSASKAERKRN